MENFIAVFQSTQNWNRIFYRRLLYHYRLETTFQSCIFFNIHTVLIQCCSTDTVQLTTSQHRFQHIACIQSAICLTGTNNGMQLINEQNDLSIAVLHIIQYGFQTFLKFTSVFCAGYQCTHIQCKNLLILQSLRYITFYNTLCQPFHHGGLTDTGFTDQYRVVLRFTGQDTYHVTDLTVSSDDRIQLLVSRFLHQILTVFFQSIISSLRIVTGNSLVASYGRQSL